MEESGGDVSSAVQVHWLTLTGASPISEQGLPAEAPLVIHDKKAPVFGEAHSLLQELVEDIGETVVLEHEEDVTKYPEVMQAIKDAGLEDGWENCFCVAICPSKSRWAVGLDYGRKGRERAAKLALALAIATDDVAEKERLSNDYPGFAELCGMQVSAAPPPAKRQRNSAGAAGAQKQKSVQKGGGVARGGGGEKGSVPRQPCDSPLTMEVPLWIQIPVDAALPGVLDDLSGGAVAVGTEGNRRDVFDTVDKVLAKLVTKPKAAIKYIDDPNWEQFPEIGAALKQHGEEQAPMMLAVCQEASAWAIGFGYSASHRNAAAKAAMAVSIVMAKAEEGTIPDLADFPKFEDFVGEVIVAS